MQYPARNIKNSPFPLVLKENLPSAERREKEKEIERARESILVLSLAFVIFLSPPFLSYILRARRKTFSEIRESIKAALFRAAVRERPSERKESLQATSKDSALSSLPSLSFSLCTKGIFRRRMVNITSCSSCTSAAASNEKKSSSCNAF